jgi:nucleoside 2-deoxyribosyltransferase
MKCFSIQLGFAILFLFLSPKNLNSVEFDPAEREAVTAIDSSAQMSIKVDLPLKIYFAAKMSKDEYRKANIKTLEKFLNKPIFRVFMPQNITVPELSYSRIEKCGYEADRAAIDWSDILFLSSPYGKDCAWEVGYASGLNKFIVANVTDTSSINDTMVISSVDLIITDQKNIYDQLLKDDRTAKKAFLMTSSDSFTDVCMPLYYVHNLHLQRDRHIHLVDSDSVASK